MVLIRRTAALVIRTTDDARPHARILVHHVPDPRFARSGGGAERWRAWGVHWVWERGRGAG
jgi:hypothetical protein